MDDRGANIDIVFRNGLKDYEVLPPADAWKNIYPVVRKKQRPYIFLRSAAMIAAIVSLSFLAYRWSAEISTGLVNNAFLMNPESEALSGANTVPLKLAEAGNTFMINPDQDISPPEREPENYVPVENGISNTRNIDFQSLIPDLSDNVRSDYRSKSPLLFENTDTPISIPVYNPQYISDIQPDKKSQRWSIAALVSPTYNLNAISGNSEFTDQLLTDDQTLLSYSGGVALYYKITKRISLQSGLYYSTFGHELAGITSFSGFGFYNQVKGSSAFEVLTSSGTVYTNNSDIFLKDGLSGDRVLTIYTDKVFDPVKADLQYLGNSLHQSYSYLELPFILRYKVIDKTVDFNIIGGLSSNFLVANAVFASSDGERYKVATTAGLNPITISSSLGMGMEYSLGRNLSLNLEPTFRYYLNSSNGIPGMKLHPYSFGVFSGLSYKF